MVNNTTTKISVNSNKKQSILIKLNLSNVHLNEEAPSNAKVTSTNSVVINHHEFSLSEASITIEFTASGIGSIYADADLYLCKGDSCAKKSFRFQFDIIVDEQNKSPTTHRITPTITM
jgi:hypothetical protein